MVGWGPGTKSVWKRSKRFYQDLTFSCRVKQSWAMAMPAIGGRWRGLGFLIGPFGLLMCNWWLTRAVRSGLPHMSNIYCTRQSRGVPILGKEERALKGKSSGEEQKPFCLSPLIFCFALNYCRSKAPCTSPSGTRNSSAPPVRGSRGPRPAASPDPSAP